VAADALPRSVAAADGAGVDTGALLAAARDLWAGTLSAALCATFASGGGARAGQSPAPLACFDGRNYAVAGLSVVTLSPSDTTLEALPALADGTAALPREYVLVTVDVQQE
jgi:hypothetical protein